VLLDLVRGSVVEATHHPRVTTLNSKTENPAALFKLLPKIRELLLDFRDLSLQHHNLALKPFYSIST
jgi:hypothetical protein